MGLATKEEAARKGGNRSRQALAKAEEMDTL